MNKSQEYNWKLSMVNKKIYVHEYNKRLIKKLGVNAYSLTYEKKVK